jgi:mannose-6-phosphate isomerase-like protein (cupin superfamily)
MDKLPVDYATSERIALGTDEIVVLASSEDTDGALFAVEVRMPPGGGPPVMHRHAPGEVYRVTEGEFTFYLGDGGRLGDGSHRSDGGGGVRRVVARAGDVVPLAGNTPHTIRNEGDVDAVAFVVHAPGAPQERFTRAAAALAHDGPPRMEDVLAVAAENGIELLGPVPTT